MVAGTRDMIKEEHTRLIARNIPGARLAFVEGDHFVAAGNPEEFEQGREEVFGKLINLARMLMQYACKLHNASEKSGSRECRKTDLIPSEQVARVHLAGNVGQLVASTVGHDEIAALLERSQVANDLAAEEVGGRRASARTRPRTRPSLSRAS